MAGTESASWSANANPRRLARRLHQAARAGGCAFDGAEKRLFKSIREILDKYDPPAVFVYQTCVTGPIGDDIEAVCKRAAEKFGKPVIPVNAPGFAWPKNLGNKLGAEALGVRVLSCISGDGRYREVASAHRAKANMMVGSKSMINIATKREQRWGIPYFEGSFYGISDMSTTLREARANIMLSGARSQFVALKAHMPWIGINQERHHAFAGYV